VRHVRRVEKAGPGAILIGDQLAGHGAPRQAAVRFLLAPDLIPEAHAGGFLVRRDDGLHMVVAGPAGFRSRLIAATSRSMEAWVCPRFGRKVPSTLISFEGELGPAPATTSLHLSFRNVP
jgi:hypothetical protein